MKYKLAIAILLTVVLSIFVVATISGDDTNLDIGLSQDECLQGDIINITARLTDDFNLPIEGMELEFSFDNEVISKATTDIDGTVIFTFDTSKVDTGLKLLNIGFSDNELYDYNFEYVSLRINGIDKEAKKYSSKEKTEKPDDTDRIKLATDCEQIIKTERVPVYGTCTYECVNSTNCTKDTTYECITGYDEVDKVKEKCSVKKVVLDKAVIDIDGYTCTVDDSKVVAVMICDSIYDGNGDGICQSGESCIKYEISDKSVKKLERNSGSAFIENDESFFVSRPNVEVQE